jgi:ABC-type lipoprotein export system ATPase subunit/glycosyltransferase involved in cell wall biosynthesis
MAPVIDARELHKRYPGCPPVLRGVSLAVESGEMVAVMGPSGCGKSTLLHLLGLLHEPDAGSLRILGADVMGLDRERAAFFRRRNLGFVMQSSNLFDFSTVYENVEFPLIYDSVPIEQRRERILRALEMVHLSGKVHYRGNRLSGGEQQRVAIARAIVNNPRILFADEPTGALDAHTGKSIMASFRALAHAGGISMIVVTHDPVVAEFCDAVYTLDAGRLTCRRKEAPRRENMDPASLAPEASEPGRVMNAFCVRGCSSRGGETAARRLLLHLYEEGFIAGIYDAGGRTGESGVDAASADLTALPARYVGLRGLPAAFAACPGQAEGYRPLLRDMWRALPLGSRRPGAVLSRARHFLCGALTARWCLEDGAELLYAPDAGDSCTAAWVAGALAGIPFSFTVRPEDLAREDPGLPVKAGAAAFVHCDTESALAVVRAACPDLPEERFLLARNGLVFAERDVRLEERFPMGGSVQLLAVGELTRRKGFDVLLRACALLCKEGVKLHCRIAGDGGLKRYLRLLARRLGVASSVEFCGRLPHARIRELLLENVIFVSPDTASTPGEETRLPTPLLEAVQCAAPVIVSDLAGHREAVRHGVSGLVTKRGSPRELADAVLRLAADHEAARSMGAAARAWALEQLAPERCGNALAERMLAVRGLRAEDP